jgi:hypothetical protein
MQPVMQFAPSARVFMAGNLTAKAREIKVYQRPARLMQVPMTSSARLAKVS